MEVRECLSSPEILELKAQCDLAPYRVAASNRLNVPSDSLDPFSKSFQDIFVEGVINCLSWRYKFFVHNATAAEKKTIIMVFTLDLLMRAFFGRELFVCHSSLCRLVSGS